MSEANDLNTLLACPFCGSDAVVICDNTEKYSYQIVGCSNRSSMLCPNPTMTIYKDAKGKIDYTYWNRRAG